MKDGKQIGKQMSIVKINLTDQSISGTHYKIPTEIATNNFFSSSFIFAVTSNNDYVCAYSYSDMLLFYSDKSKQRIIGPKGLVKFDNSKFMPKMVETYTGITVSNGYIFCTYSGETAKIDGKFDPSNKYIRVFNENREYVKTFFIDENIQNICYDKINKQIIAYTLDRETPFISFKVNL